MFAHVGAALAGISTSGYLGKLLENHPGVSKDELQEDFNEDAGISPLAIEVVMGILFCMVMCIVCPLIYMMRKSNSGTTASFSVKKKKSSTVDQDTNGRLEDHV